MPRRLSPRALLTGLFLFFLPLLCGVVVLAGHAQRNWSLHWAAPQTVIASTSSYDYSAVTTPRGWDIAWSDPQGQLVLSRFDRVGQRLLPDVHLNGTPTASPQSLTLGRAGGTDVLAWRQDTSNGSTLRTATVRAGAPPVYKTLASGVQPIEHPFAFTAGRQVDVVFSWQKPSFNVFLTQIRADGTASQPVALTHSTTYAYSPRAVVDATGFIRLLYLNQCCSSSAFNVLTQRFTTSGIPVGKAQTLGQIVSIAGQGQGASPDRWGIDESQDGRRTWGAWSGDQGLEVVAWSGAQTVVSPHIVVPGTLVQDLVLDVAGGRGQLIWRQPYNLGTYLGTIRFDGNGAPTDVPDRVAFESAADDVPMPLKIGGIPAVLWQSHPTKTTITRVELSLFSPSTLPAPSLGARLGLGLANPLGSAAVLIVGSFLFGVVLTVANIMLVLLCVLLFVILFRRLQTAWKWYAYAASLVVVLYGLFVVLGAPSPPVLFLVSLSGTAGTVTLVGLVLFILVLMRRFLARMDDVYKAGALAFAAFYFIAFLQAVMIIQDQIGTS
jgi:hypothetical protein